MDASTITGIVGFLVLLLLMALEVPIGVALGSVAIAGIYFLIGWSGASSIVSGTVYEFSASWSLSAIPMFLLMGSVLHRTGLVSIIYRAARLWLSFLPGGLAVATSVASAGFAATSGSSMATAAAMARLAVPEMISAGYDKKLAAGTVASAGTLGALIPPSILMILYGVMAEVSINKMLLAGILPGLLTLAIYTLMIMGRCLLNPDLAPRSLDSEQRKERWRSLRAAWPLPVIFLCVLGGIYGGFVTATEAAALGSIISIGIAIVIGRFSFQVLVMSIRDTLMSTAQIFFIAIGAAIFTRFLTLTGLSIFLSDTLMHFSVSPIALIIAVSIMYVVLGTFLDPLGVMLISIPIVYPIFQSMNMDAIWVGVIIVKYVEIGLLTPPVGLNAYVIKSVVGDQINIADIFKGISWFLLCEVIIIFLLIFFPQISLIIPESIHG